VASYYLPEYLQNARRPGIGDAGDSAIEEADHARDLQTGGRYRRIGDHLVTEQPLRSRD
jgi:hypothetical protein